jgi:hypothetical protein
MLDSMAAAARTAQAVRVAVLPDGDTPRRAAPAARKRKARRRR